MVMNILMWVADTAGCGHVRINLPAKYLNKNFSNIFNVKTSQVMNPNEWVTLLNKEKSLYQKNFNLTVHQRQYGAPNLQNMRFLQDKLKIPCVYEIDDYLHKVHPQSSAYYAYNPATNVERFKNIDAYLRDSKAITVTTNYLKNVYSIYNKNIYVLENYIDLDEIFTDEIRKTRECRRMEHEAKGEIWIGWAGSNTHLPDLNVAKDAMIRILNEFPNVKLCLGGWDGFFRDKEGKIHYPETNPWKDVPENKKIVIPWAKDMKDYPKMLSHFDIGIAPLEDNDFNRCKSDIKFKEYAGAGVPVIASSVEPYAKSIKNGVDGLLVQTKGAVFNDWYKKIKSLVENRELRLQMAENVQKRAIVEFDMDKNVYKWKDAYLEIIQRG